MAFLCMELVIISSTGGSETYPYLFSSILFAVEFILFYHSGIKSKKMMTVAPQGVGNPFLTTMLTHFSLRYHTVVWADLFCDITQFSRLDVIIWSMFVKDLVWGWIIWGKLWWRKHQDLFYLFGARNKMIMLMMMMAVFSLGSVFRPVCGKPSLMLFYAPIKYSTQITQYTDIRIKSISMQIKAF